MEEILSAISHLALQRLGITVSQITRLPQSGSDRTYFRLRDETDRTYIATYGSHVRENQTFLYFSTHLLDQGCPVPRILAVNDETTIYIQEDFGDITLLDIREREGLNDTVYGLFRKALRELARLQILGDRGLDYDRCITSRAFGEKAIMADLLYFKYYFLDTLQLPYDKEQLIDEFQRFSAALADTGSKYFMYRDFQSRNIMVTGSDIHFIDYQGGMKGALQYDVASLLWQARAALPPDWKKSLLEDYIDAVEGLLPEPPDRESFRAQYQGYVLIRLLQVLGAYGFRGLFERKAHFLNSIPRALENLEEFLGIYELGDSFPESGRLLRLLSTEQVMSRFRPLRAAPDAPLVVQVQSFSYKKGIPPDRSGNGGGFVFDCRGLLNPGRFEEYRHLTGRDPEVREFLEQRTRIHDFLQHVLAVVDITVEDYLRRGFSSLQVSFGCTGGQHRSVFAAEYLARHLRSKYGVRVVLSHREQEHLQEEEQNGINR